MYKKITSRIKKASKNCIFKRKITFPIVFLILILTSYLIFHNIPSKEIIEAKPDNENTIESEDSSLTEEDNFATKDASSLNKATIETTLINDNRGIPVLYYHSVRESADNEVTITPELLRTQLQYIRDEGYVTLTLSELKAYILNNSPIPAKSILITFDDGYMDNYDKAFPILKDLNMVATIFCIASNLDGTYYLSNEAIIEMSNYGIDIESHTVTHPKLNEMTYNKQL